MKAAGGGGGKGFRVALTEEELQGAFEGSSREGEKFFSDPTVYLERYLPDPRHVEVQILADTHGNVIHLGRAGLLDPAPPPEADRGVPRAGVGRRRGDARPHRRRSGSRRPRAVDYVGAGTIEGLFVSGSSNGKQGGARPSTSSSR